MRGWAIEDLEIVPPCVVCRVYAWTVRLTCVVCVSVLCVCVVDCVGVYAWTTRCTFVDCVLCCVVACVLCIGVGAPTKTHAFDHLKCARYP